MTLYMYKYLEYWLHNYCMEDMSKEEDIRGPDHCNLLSKYPCIYKDAENLRR